MGWNVTPHYSIARMRLDASPGAPPQGGLGLARKGSFIRALGGPRRIGVWMVAGSPDFRYHCRGGIDGNPPQRHAGLQIEGNIVTGRKTETPDEFTSAAARW